MTQNAHIRLPAAPYPGLRPFLDHEAALLFGRARQVREIIERMQQTHFVAVIGGSGSGKSSLIRAGVVPELRSFGIRGAGDFWIPVVCTPGTNPGPATQSSGRDTPISRLAWKFSKILKSRGSESGDAQRLAEIADVFRQDGGFTRLVDSYDEELLLAPGLAAKDARLLFVIDQFEELFHPTNKADEDCALLIERVIDHFFNPHPRCFVVLTMRSEHLSDCAGFLELPDAINKSGYLVRRLGQDELREAVVGPAQRFLRLLARQGEADGRPMEAVEFEQRLLDRLLRDVQAITQDPDHLPLLQHLLARLWEAALEREGQGGKVPARIEWDDLLRAVSPARPGQAPALEDKVNTLRSSLENWAQAQYEKYSQAQRPKVDAVLRQLAIKDPNTGQYTQQRINVSDCASVLGAGCVPADLRSLVEDRFIGSVDYLFWDDENPARMTLKVSHESFIRGWRHFRKLIDEEAERFEEFVVIYRKCASWAIERETPNDRLLERGDFRRIEDAKLEGVFADKRARAQWLGVLRQDRDGARLEEFEPRIDEFLRKSRDRVEASQKQRKYVFGLLGGLAVVVLLMLFPVSYAFLIQGPVAKAAEKYFDAGGMAGQARVEESYRSVGAAAGDLGILRAAAANVQAGRSEAPALLDYFSWLGPVKRQETFLLKVAGQSEPIVNGQLRTLLSSALWKSAGSAKVSSKPAGPGAAQPQPVRCSGIRTPELEGRLFLENTRLDGGRQRGIFVPDRDPERESEVVFREAMFQAEGRRCTHGEIFWSAPRFLNPSVLVDSDARYFLYTIETVSQGPSPVTAMRVHWGSSESGGLAARASRMTVLLDADAAQNLRNEVKNLTVQAANTWREPGGSGMSVSKSGWRVVLASAQEVEIPAGELGSLDPLARAEPGSACHKIGENLGPYAPPPGFQVTMYEGVGRCFAINHGNPRSPAGQATADKDGADKRKAMMDSASENIVVAVYQKPVSDGTRRPNDVYAPIASLPDFGRFETRHNLWYVGKSGPYEGWIFVASAPSRGTRYFGTPWSTDALMRLSDELLSHHDPANKVKSASQADPGKR